MPLIAGKGVSFAAVDNETRCFWLIEITDDLGECLGYHREPIPLKG